MKGTAHPIGVHYLINACFDANPTKLEPGSVNF